MVYLVTLAIVALCVIGLCFNIIFRKDGEFPDTEISSNKEMRKLGIRCAKEEEMRLWGKKSGANGHPTCSDSSCSDCASCGLYKKEEQI